MIEVIVSTTGIKINDTSKWTASIEVRPDQIFKFVKDVLAAVQMAPFWRTADGRSSLVSQLDDSHLINILRFEGIYDKPRSKMLLAVLEELTKRALRATMERANPTDLDDLPSREPMKLLPAPEPTYPFDRQLELD